MTPEKEEELRQLVRDAADIISTTRFHRWEENFQKACNFLGKAQEERLYQDKK